MDDDDDLGLFTPSTAVRQRATAGRRQAKPAAVSGMRIFQRDGSSTFDLTGTAGSRASDQGETSSSVQKQLSLGVDALPPAPGDIFQPNGQRQKSLDSTVATFTTVQRERAGTTAATGAPTTNPKQPPTWDIDAMLFGDDKAAPSALPAAMPLPAASPAAASAGTAASPVQAKGMSRRKQAQLEETERKHRDKYAEEKEVEIGQLQSLEDAAKDEIGTKVAEAPKVHMARRMHALHDLESKGVQRVRQHLAEKFGPDVDFSVLLSCLLSEEEVEEKDEYWDENLLLTEVVSELETLKDSVGELDVADS